MTKNIGTPPRRTGRAVLPQPAHRCLSPDSMQPSPPWPIRLRGDDTTNELQAQRVGEGKWRSTETSPPALLLPPPQDEPVPGIPTQRLKGVRGVAVTKVAHPATEEAVHVLHNSRRGQQRPRPHRQFTDAVPRPLHRSPRGPTCEESDVPVTPRTHPAVFEAEELKPLASFPQVHDARLRRLELQAELTQQVA